jgi:plasmid stabilization system protein ParE
VKPFSFHPEAAEEYFLAARYYSNIQPELGGRFFDEIERLIQDIRERTGFFRPFDPPARRNLSTVFPYAVIYLEQPDQIWIVAVMHGKRRPGYWRERLT